MRSSHASSRDSIGSRVRTDPGAQNADTRSEDIKAATVVGERGARITGISSADRDGRGLRSRGVVGGVRVVVTSCHDNGDAGRDGRSHGAVDGGGFASSEGHGEDGFGGRVVGYPLDAADDAAVGAGSVLVEDFDGDEFGGFGDAVGASSDCAGAVSTVSVLVGVLFRGS